MKDSQSVLDFDDRDWHRGNPSWWEARPQVSPQLFAGFTYAEHDHVSRCRLMQAVFDCMKDGRGRTLAEIHAIVCGGSAASTSARLRDFRKRQRGQSTVYRLSNAGGLIST